jgi:hypothetical protein
MSSNIPATTRGLVRPNLGFGFDELALRLRVGVRQRRPATMR